jgi:DNA-binding NtrC family response regulator
MGYRALVIDDDPAVRTVVQRYLAEQVGLEVATAQSGAEAMSQLDRSPVDLVVTDLKMPGLSGIEVIEATRQRCPRAEILLMTGFATVESAVHAMKLGAFDYLQKPFPLPQLGSMVERALERIKSRRAEPIDSFLAPGSITASVYREAERMAASDLPVLIAGEAGTGKVTLARAMHTVGPRRAAPVRTLRCGALDQALQEAELLRPGGLGDEAAGGTLVVAQVWSAAPAVQRELVRMLDALDAAAGKPTGPGAPARPARIIATTDRDLSTRARRGGFRPDLYERLAPRTLHIPPLRERRDEIVPLALGLVTRISARIEGPANTLAPDAAAWLEARAWPGNVSELVGTLERAVLAAQGAALTAADLDAADGKEARRTGAAEDEGPASRRERERIMAALKRNNYNLTLSYQQLGMSRTTLWRKLKRYGITLTRSVDDPEIGAGEEAG